MLAAIVAVDENWGIGAKNDLLFHLPLDMKYFKQKTKNSVVAMGYNTLLSLPNSKPLKNRVNVVLCPEGIEIDNTICLHDFNQTVKFLKILAKEYDVFIIGGAMFYQSMLPYCDKVFVTKVHEKANAEVFFPNLDIDYKDNFVIVYESDSLQDGKYTISFTEYKRINN